MREFESVGFDKSKPTLFIAECVLVYLDPAETSQMLATLASTVTDACFINYEMVLSIALRPHTTCKFGN